MLFLERAYTVAGREDRVVRTTHEPQVAVCISAGPISGEVVAIPDDARGLARLLPVLLEEHGRAERAMSPGSSGGHSWPSMSTTLTSQPGRLAHRARAHLEAGEVADEEGVLRLAVAIVDGQALQLLPPLNDRGVHGLAGRDRVPARGEVGPFEFGGLGE
jgi:hypothetical protein